MTGPKTGGRSLPVSKLHEGSQWLWEIKLDHYRAIEVKTSETILYSYSRNHKTFNKRFPLPADTLIDGEVVALDESGRPDFHCLQHFTAEASRIHYFAKVCATTGELCNRILEGGAP